MFKNIAILFIFILSFVVESDAQFNLSQFLMQTQNIRGMGNFGTEFYFTIPQTLFKTNGNNPTVELVVFSYHQAQVEISVPSKSWKEIAEIQKNTEKIFEIQPEVAFTEILNGPLPSFREVIYRKSAIKVTSDYPIAIYALVGGEDQGEAMMLLPTSSLGKNYLLSSYIDPTSQIISLIPNPAIAGIVAPFDNTRITIRQNSSGIANFPITKYLDAGDCWYVYLTGINGDLSGLEVEADKPISIVTANQYANVPVQHKPGNYLLEMELPSMFWGRTFHIPKYMKRLLNPITKIYANQPETKVFLNGELITTLNSSTNPKNFIEYRIPTSNVSGIDVLSSDKPINVNLYNTTYTEEIPNKDYMLPNRLILVPVEQYNKSLLMNAPNFLLKNPNAQFNLVLITKVNLDGSIPDNLEISYVVDNRQIRKKISELNIIDKKDANYLIGNRFTQLTIPITFSSNFEIFGEEFTAYVISTDGEAFYGFIGGINLIQSPFADQTPPKVIWNQLCDGTVLGLTTDMPDDDKIRSNLNIPIFHSNVSKNYEKTFSPVIPGTTKSMNWELKVRDKSQNAFAVITFRDYAGNDTTIVIEYRPKNLSVSPTIIDFGRVKPNDINIQNCTIKNVSDTILTINNLELKNGTSHFKFVDFKPTKLNPGEEILVKVSFEATKSGIYTDSLGINNGCFTYFYSQLIARIGDPKIIVSDLNIGEIPQNSQQTLEAEISNIGESNLIINSYSISNPSEINVELGTPISNQNPLIIEPNQTFKYKIYFKPSKEKYYNDHIIFHSNANGIDSIAYLVARVVKPGLTVTSFNGPKVRLDRSKIPSAIIFPNAIKIENTGSTNVTLTDYLLFKEKSINPNSFDINFSDIIGKTLKPKEKLYLDVKFYPIHLGENKLFVEFKSDIQQVAQSSISFFVVIPKIVSEPNVLTFDTTLINTPTSESRKSVKIKNLNSNEWEYADTLVIYGLKSFDKKLSTTREDFSKNPFYFNQYQYKFPLVLLPGNSLDLEFIFNAKQLDADSTEIIIETNAIEDQTIKLVGWGANKSISLTNLNLETCVGSSAIGECEIKNNSSQPVVIEKLELTNTDHFRILDPVENLTLLPNTKHSLRIKFESSVPTMQSTDLLCYLSGDMLPSYSAKITAKSIFHTILTNSSPISQNIFVGNPITVKYSIIQQKEKFLVLEEELKVKINFTEEFLKFNPNSIKLGKKYSGKWKISNVENPRKFGTIEFSLISLNGPQTIEEGDIFELSFDTFTPSTQSNTGLINIVLESKENNCYEFENKTSLVNINLGCGGELQKFLISDENYFLKTPSFLSVSNNLDIEFGLGFDGFAKIEFYNSIGQIQAIIVSEHLRKGRYYKSIDLTNLSSGNYFLIYQAGEYLETKSIRIIK